MNTENFQSEWAIIIPTYSNKEGLTQVLHSLVEHEGNGPVVIVNNNQNRVINSELLNETHHLNIIVIDEHANYGFAKACNDGAEAAERHFNPDYYIFLNDDITFIKPWIKTCIMQMKKKKWVMTAPLLKRADGKVENYGYKVLSIGKVLEYKEHHTPIDGLSAAALIIERAAFTTLKGFDEKFFAYLEDVDLFLRAKKKNYLFGLTESVSVIHHGQQTSSRMPLRKSLLDMRNWWYLLLKHWSINEVVKNLPGIFIERLRNISGVIKSFVPYLNRHSSA